MPVNNNPFISTGTPVGAIFQGNNMFDQLKKKSLGSLGFLAFITVLSYYFGYEIGGAIADWVR